MEKEVRAMSTNLCKRISLAVVMVVLLVVSSSAHALIDMI